VTSATAIEVRLADSAGVLVTAARSGTLLSTAAEEGLVAWVEAHGRAAGRGTDTLPGAGLTVLPIRHRGRGLGVLVIGFDPPRGLPRQEHDILAALVDQTAVTLKSLEKR
jgi:two-component system sensor histidine kinase KdpD